MRLHTTLKKHILKYDINKVSKNGVYRIYHVEKPGIFYVGSTKREYKQKTCKNGCYGRWVEHYLLLKKNKHHSQYLQNTINKYGIDGIRFEVILNIEWNVREVEKEYIDLYDSYNSGYNCSEETKHISMPKESRIKQANRMRTNNPMKNKEVVAKMLKTNKEVNPPLEKYFNIV